MKRYVWVAVGALGAWLAAAGCGAAAPTEKEVEANHRLWPGEVTMTANAPVTLYQGKKRAGNQLLSVGETYSLESVADGRVILDIDGKTAEVRIDNTDLMKRVAAGEETDAAGDAAALSSFVDHFAGDLVYLDGRKLVPFPARKLAGVKYYGLYYSAHWCGPCRAFTPELVKFYNKIKRKHPEFEIIFYSYDKTAEDMLNYMIEMKMDWPALAFKSKDTADTRGITRLYGKGIPCLILVDADGKVLSANYDSSRAQVLEDIEDVLQGKKLAKK